MMYQVCYTINNFDGTGYIPRR